MRHRIPNSKGMNMSKRKDLEEKKPSLILRAVYD
jgi:hypothetical protein